MKYKYILIAVISFFLLSCEETNRDSIENNSVRKSASIVDSTGKIKYDLNASQNLIHKIKAARIEELFNRLYKSRQFSGSVLVAEDGKIIYEAAKGYEDYHLKKELTVHSSFHLASVSKQFTAMSIVMLKEKGKLKYDDDIKKYLPDIPYDGITIRQLLNHTSGIPNILNYVPYFMTFWDSCQVAENCDLPYIYTKSKPAMQFKPGNRFSYNNTGYVLLALIVERVSKIPFNEFVEKNIFVPLQMEDSKVYSIVKEPEIKNRVFGYGHHRGIYNKDEDDVRNGLMGEKGVYSSVIDLYKWDQALYTEILVKQSTLKEVFEYGKVNNGRRINYGFGWRKSKDNEQIVYHFGHWRGFKACIIRFIDDKKLIVILNNTGNKQIKNFAQDLIDILYSDRKEIPKI